MVASRPISSAPLGSLLALNSPPPGADLSSGIWAQFAAMIEASIDFYKNGVVRFEVLSVVRDPTNPTKSTVESEDLLTIDAYVEGYSDREIDNNFIHIGDRCVILKASQIGRSPEKGEDITIDEVYHNVVNVAQWPASGTVCFYLVQARTANA